MVLVFQRIFISLLKLVQPVCWPTHVRVPLVGNLYLEDLELFTFLRVVNKAFVLCTKL